MFPNTLIASSEKPAAPVILTVQAAGGARRRVSRTCCAAFWNRSPWPSPGCTGCTTIAAAPLLREDRRLRLEHQLGPVRR